MQVNQLLVIQMLCKRTIRELRANASLFLAKEDVEQQKLYLQKPHEPLLDQLNLTINK